MEKVGLSRYIEAVATITGSNVYLTAAGLSVMAALAAAAVVYLSKRERREKIKPLAVYALIAAQLFFAAVWAAAHFANVFYPPLYDLLGIFSALIFIALLFLTGWRKNLDLTLFIFLPFVFTFIIYIPFVHSSIYGRGYYLTLPSVTLSLLLSYAAVNDIPLKLPFKLTQPTAARVALFILSFAFGAGFLYGKLRNTPEGLPASALTHTVESGFFKGIRSAPERGQAITFLESEIRRHTDENDRVLFLDLAPYAYMMTDAKHNTPTTWDIIGYFLAYPTRHADSMRRDRYVEGSDYANDRLLHEYFKTVGEYLTKIIFINDPEWIEQISLLDDNWPFNGYIAQHYTQTYANDAALYSITVFTRN
jgi:hypothetical protein